MMLVPAYLAPSAIEGLGVYSHEPILQPSRHTVGQQVSQQVGGVRAN